MCACNVTFHSVFYTVLFSLDQQQTYKPVQLRVLPGERRTCLRSSKGVTAVDGGVGSFNRVIHSVLSLREAGGTDHFLQLILINNPNIKLFMKLWTQVRGYYSC